MEALNASDDDLQYLLGLFSYDRFDFASLNPNHEKQPSLLEMTRAALQVLSRGPKGFLLIVEGIFIFPFRFYFLTKK